MGRRSEPKPFGTLLPAVGAATACRGCASERPFAIAWRYELWFEAADAFPQSARSIRIQAHAPDFEPRFPPRNAMPPLTSGRSPMRPSAAAATNVEATRDRHHAPATVQLATSQLRATAAHGKPLSGAFVPAAHPNATRPFLAWPRSQLCRFA
jgi:hypothetical protein